MAVAVAELTPDLRRRRPHRDALWWIYAAGKVIAGAVFVLAALFPVAWMIIAGFKSKTEVISTPFQFFPEVWKWQNYAQILADPTFTRTMLWTFLGAVLFTVLALSVNSLAAYAFARLDFRFKRTLWVIVITTMFIPGMTILLTSFIVVTRLEMLDTLAVLVIPGAASAGMIFFIRQFYLSIPSSLEEAAMLDGFGRFRIFTHLFLPLSKPPFVVMGITAFLAYWNSYVCADRHDHEPLTSTWCSSTSRPSGPSAAPSSVCSWRGRCSPRRRSSSCSSSSSGRSSATSRWPASREAGPRGLTSRNCPQ